eukprot:8452589-Alexandrium_andersonii.AAC.1
MASQRRPRTSARASKPRAGPRARGRNASGSPWRRRSLSARKQSACGRMSRISGPPSTNISPRPPRSSSSPRPR